MFFILAVYNVFQLCTYSVSVVEYSLRKVSNVHIDSNIRNIFFKGISKYFFPSKDFFNIWGVKLLVP